MKVLHKKYIVNWSIFLTLVLSLLVFETFLSFSRGDISLLNSFSSFFYIGICWIDLALHRSFFKKVAIEEEENKVLERFTYQSFFKNIDYLSSIPWELFAYLFPQWIILFHLLKFVRILKIKRIQEVMLYINNINKKIKIYFILQGVFIAIHVMSCLWIILTPLEKAPFLDTYIKSFYWTITTLTTVGYGDITPQTNITRIYTMAIMIIGVGFYGILFGLISNLIFTENRYQEANKQKLEDLTLFMNHYQIPEKVQKQTFSFYKHTLKKRLSENDDKIISELPKSLQDELTTYMKVKLIRNVLLFKGESIHLLKLLANSLQVKCYAPGDDVIVQGETGKEMYIIGHGIVDVLMGDPQKIVTSLKNGDYVGEVALIKEEKRMATVRARSYCDLYVLTKEDLLPVLDKYPNLLEKMKKVIDSYKK